jgi:hypothetical protein
VKVKRHVIEVNGVVTDIFQHSWSTHLEGEFKEVYTQPPYNSFVGGYVGQFEDNRLYEALLKPAYASEDWNQASWAISMAKAMRLMLQVEVGRRRRRGRRSGAGGSLPQYMRTGGHARIL